ncbi:response regulator transcription factor [Clostridium beijerinckii]|uniref:Stage 0 sporulation protein A homolog n=1 Tax=Clostridium beijerinckii TaxID=1520 RepID=A0A1S9N5Z9_CLOBE|nr:response regulator transcription factor [Clostridium beijerinckii]OOP72783.1 hypothetical protein CBEIBR21_13255 [Clostridium beijerinckii]
MYKIIIVDNLGENADCIKSMDIWEKRVDFEIVKVVKDEKKVLDVIRDNNINMVFILANGREIKDIEIIREMKNSVLDVSMIIISKFSDYNNIREGFLAGAFDYIIEPISPVYINSALNRIYEKFEHKYVKEEMISKINALVENIFLGGDNVIYICKEIVESIYLDLDNETITSNIATDRAKEKIYEKLVKNKTWLKKFIWAQNYTYKKGFVVKTKEEIFNEWKRDFVQVARVIKKYQVLDNKLIYHIGKYVVVHVDEKLTLESVSKAVYLNKSYISHIFRRETGISFVEFITDVKIDRAKILLLDNERKICEIALLIGYSDAEYFSKIFKLKTGLTPTQFREEINQKN